MNTKFTIPSNKTASEFGKVNVYKVEEKLEVELTILMEPQGRYAEGWQTGVALDASSSMKTLFGLLKKGQIPKEVEVNYQKNGWIQVSQNDGHKVKIYSQKALDDACSRGYLQTTTNIIEPLAHQFIAYLAENLDVDGGTTLIYWACGKGDEIEVVGDFTETQCSGLPITGPQYISFGQETILTPAIRYFVDRFHDAKRGIYIFITDGKINDLAEVKRYTTQLAQEISQAKRNYIKFVLIGVGSHIDETQMEELDHLDTGTDVDIWDHKIAKEMRALIEIFAEVVNENQIMAPTGFIYDATGNIVKKYSDGLPAKISFSMPDHSSWFELHAAGKKIRQYISAD